MGIDSQLEKMKQDWDRRARENARYYVATGREQWTDEEFFASGEQHVAEEILTDMTNICQGTDPKDMSVLEIGCGAGRVTRALARRFGTVYAVDISGEMVEQARAALRDYPNARIFQNSGADLKVLQDEHGAPPSLDFAFSTIVFQHIPSRQVIETYVREVHRLLKPGRLFKFQVQGAALTGTHPEDTWLGVSFTEAQAREMAEGCGFELRYHYGSGDQYFWLWYFKK